MCGLPHSHTVIFIQSSGGLCDLDSHRFTLRRSGVTPDLIQSRMTSVTRVPDACASKQKSFDLS